MNDSTASIVLATAGRDQEGLFFVVGESDGYLLLANGKGRKLANPKRKNPRHVCPVDRGDFDHPVIRKLAEGNPVTDRELRRALAAFKEGNSLG